MVVLSMPGYHCAWHKEGFVCWLLTVLLTYVGPSMCEWPWTVICWCGPWRTTCPREVSNLTQLDLLLSLVLIFVTLTPILTQATIVPHHCYTLKISEKVLASLFKAWELFSFWYLSETQEWTPTLYLQKHHLCILTPAENYQNETGDELSRWNFVFVFLKEKL